MKSGASGYSVLAAPEDGRTPPTSPPPSLRDYAPTPRPGGKALSICNFQTEAAGSRYVAMDQLIPTHRATSTRIGSGSGGQNGKSPCSNDSRPYSH